MARGAPVAETLVVRIILSVTVDAFPARIRIHRGQVALLAGHHGMQPDQRKPRQAMIKAHLLRPATLVMTAPALLPLLALMHIIGAMTVAAGGPQLLVRDLAAVTRRTGNLPVTSAQRKTGLLVVIKACFLPAARYVAGFALLAIRALVLVHVTVT